MRFLLIIAAPSLALAACQKPAGSSPPPTKPRAAAEAGPVKGVDRSHKGQPAPDASFNDPDGGEISLAELQGHAGAGQPVGDAGARRASRSLPTLDKLAAAHRDDGSSA